MLGDDDLAAVLDERVRQRVQRAHLFEQIDLALEARATGENRCLTRHPMTAPVGIDRTHYTDADWKGSSEIWSCGA